jgi:PAS domain S-box-containing protein
VSDAVPRPPRLLHLEDDPNDADLMAAHLQAAGVECEITRVETREEFVGAIQDRDLQLIVTDYSLPGFDGLAALEIASHRRPEVPVIMLSGTLGEDVAIDCMRRGATDYVLKDSMQRIVPAVRRAVEVADERRQRARAEQRLIETMEVLNRSPAVTFVWRDEPGWLIEQVSDNVRRLVGYTPDELIGGGMPFAELIHPDDRDRVTAQRGMSDPDGGGIGSHPPYRLVTRTGGEVWVDEALLPPRDEEDRGRIHGIVIDITARHRAQTEVRRLTQLSEGLLGTINDGVGILDADDGWEFINGTGAEILGVLPSEVIGHRFADSLAPDDRERYENERPKWIDGISSQGEYEMVHRAGRPVPVVLGISARFEEGRFIGTMVVFSDRSELRRAEEEQRRLENHLLQSQKLEALGTLAGGIAHDFNNILQVMLMSAELLESAHSQRRPIDGRLQELNRTILRAQRLVEQILAFSRRSEEHIEAIDLKPLVKEVLKMLREMVPSSVEIRSRIDGDGLLVRADPTQMHQIIMNLSTNAVHAIGSGQGVVEVHLAARSMGEVGDPPGLAPGRYVCLSVADDGAGIAPEHLDRIFDPYFTTKKQGEGTGLGLAVVHGIVTKAGGHIDVTSDPGQGTTFRIHLPICEGEPAGEATPDIPLPGGGERLLCVDDEPDLARLQGELLEVLGYQVTVMTSSAEALEAVRHRPDGFDLLITDQTMPEISGVELIESVRTFAPDLPVILCTGFGADGYAVRASSLGVREVLSKPMKVFDLAKAVRRALEQEGPPQSGNE